MPGRSSIAPSPTSILNAESPHAYKLTYLVGWGGVNLVTRRLLTQTGGVGNRNDGLLFSQATSYLTLGVAYDGSVGVGSTIAVWFNTQQTNNFCLIGRNSGGVGDLYIGSQSTSTVLFYDGNLLNHTRSCNRDGVWHLAVFTLGGAYGNGMGYVGIDGYISFATNGIGNGTANRIGYDGGGTNDQLAGSIASVAMWSREMTASEVWELYDPRTRWDLYWQPSNRAYSFMSVAAAAAGYLLVKN
jgi:hypothetical protein